VMSLFRFQSMATGGSRPVPPVQVVRNTGTQETRKPGNQETVSQPHLGGACLDAWADMVTGRSKKRDISSPVLITTPGNDHQAKVTKSGQ
jgi:hypothetical protein